MKRAVLLFGLSIAVLAGCGQKDESKTDPSSGDVDPRRSTVEADRTEGVIADGVDSIAIRIVAKDKSGMATKERPVEISSTIDSDVFTFDSPTTDSSGATTVRLTAVKAGVRVVSVKVEGIRLNATGQALTLAFVPGPASKLAFVVAPSAGQVGVPLTPAVKVEILDANGNVTTGTDEVTLKVESGDDTQTVAAFDGVATFAGFRISTPDKSHKLVATAAGLASVTSRGFAVTPGAPAKLTFEQQPTGSVTAGQPIRMKIAVRDSMGNVINNGPGAATTVRVRLYSNPTRALLEGVVAAEAVEGIATFDDVRLTRNASGYSLTAFADTGAFQSVESQSFEVKAAAPSQEASSMSLAPTIAVADGKSAVKIAVRLTDAYGNEVANQAVQLRASGAGNVFSPKADLFTNSVGRLDAQLTSSLAELKTVTANVVGQFEMVGSVLFNAGDISPNMSSFVADKASATADGADFITFQISLRDLKGNPVVGQPAIVSSSGTANTWAAPGASVLTDEDGLASFVLSTIKAESKTVTVSVGGMVMSETVAFTAGTAVKAKSTIVSGNSQTQVVGTPLAAPFKVRIMDANSNPVPGNRVFFTVLTGGGTLDGPTLTTKEVFTADDGTAEVTLTVGITAGSNSVTAQSVDWAGGEVLNLTATTRPGAPASFTLYPATGRTTTKPVATVLSTADRVGVLVVDQYNNPVPSIPVLFDIVSQPPGATTGAGITNGTTGTSGATLGIAYPGNTRLSQKAGDNVFNAKCNTAIVPNPCGTLGATELTFTISGTALAANAITAESGNAQTGGVTTALANPLVAKVTDTHGNAVAGQAVTFIAQDGGQVLTSTATTDLNGLAQATYRLGTVAGANRNVLRAEYSSTKFVMFTATVNPGTATTLVATAGNNQSGAVGAVLAPFEVTVRDTHGNAVGVGVGDVTFTVASGGGRLTGSVTTVVVPVGTSGANLGKASTILTLGNVAGPNTVTATLGALGPVTFTATANPGPITQLTAVGSTSGSGTVGQQLADFVVEARDAQNNLVVSRNNAVTFAVAGGNGASITPSGAVATDANGRASVRLTLGTKAGANLYTVTATGGTATPVQFIGSAVAGAATTLAVQSGDNQSGRISHPLANPIVAKVSDSNGNGKSGVAVNFQVIGGNGSVNPATATTDADGLAQTTWTLGSAVGAVHIIRATSAGLQQQPLIEATGHAPFNTVEVFAGDGQLAAPGSQFGAAIVALVEDDLGDPVAGATVTFATSGDATVVSASATSDANGRAWTMVDAGTTVGPVTVSATATDATAGVDFTLEIADFPADLCTGYGPAFQSFAPTSLSAAAGEYSAGLINGSEVRYLVAQAIGSGLETVAVGLSCTDGTDTHVLEIYPSGAYVDGAALVGSGVGFLVVQGTAGSWDVDCNGDLQLTVPAAVNGAFRSVSVESTASAGTWQGGICGDTTGTAPLPVTTQSLFLTTP